jgi:hypothetical protein
LPEAEAHQCLGHRNGRAETEMAGGVRLAPSGHEGSQPASDSTAAKAAGGWGGWI